MVPSPRHAWTIGRLLAGKPVKGEVDELLPPFRAIGRRMLDLTPETRMIAWEAFLDGHEDRAEIVKAVASTNPDGPPPGPTEVDSDAGADWGPIRFGTLPPAEPFPLEVLPIPVRDLAEAAARSIGCPRDFPAVACLAAASGLIGRSATLLVKPGYFESASLYVALVGSPSSGKSPSLRAALAPLRAIGKELYEAWRVETDAWEELPEKTRGHGPILRRVISTDPTTEALAPILALGPRGMTIVPDEMTKWSMSMDQYKGGKGGDRPFYLSVWGGESVVIDRAKFMKEPIMVPNPFLTVAGGMTPGMLSELSEARGREDGFTARLLFSYPDRVPRPYSEEGVPEWAARAWNDLARALWDRPMRDLDGRPSPHVVVMNSEARREWRDWCQSHRQEQEAEDFPEALEGPWGKLEAYAARLALILHLMDLAADPTRPTAGTPPEMPRRIIVDAARLVAYFKSHAHRMRAATGGKGDHGGEEVHLLTGWIVRNDKAEFSLRDIGKDFDRFKQDPASLVDALAWMVAHNLIRPRPEPDDSGSKAGRKPSPRYQANPALRESPRFRHSGRMGPAAGASEVNDGNAPPMDYSE